MALILATFFWGSSFITVSTALEDTNPYALVIMRFGCGLLLLLPLIGKDLFRIPRSTWLAGAMSGFWIFITYLTNTMGLVTLSSSESGFLMALYVPFTPLLMWMVYSKAPQAGAILGVIIAFAGLILLANPFTMTFENNWGEIVTIASAFFSAIEIIVVGRYAPKCEARHLAFTQLVWVTAIGLCFYPIALGTGLVHKGITPTWNLALCMLWLGTIVAVVQVLLSWAQRFISPDRAAIVFAMESVFAAIIGYFVGERLGISGLLGGSLIVAAIIISELKVVNDTLTRWFKRPTKPA